MDIWTLVVIPLLIAVLSGVIQLYLEYWIIQPKKANDLHSILYQAQRTNKVTLTESELFSGRLLGVIRVMVVFLLSFGAVSVAASVGYEIKGMPGMIWGTIIGLLLSLIALWAINEWQRTITKTASVLALICLMILVLSGFITTLAQLAGLSISFSQGLLIVALGLLLLIILVIFAVLGEMFPESPFGKAWRGELDVWKDD